MKKTTMYQYKESMKYFYLVMLIIPFLFLVNAFLNLTDDGHISWLAYLINVIIGEGILSLFVFSQKKVRFTSNEVVLFQKKKVFVSILYKEINEVLIEKKKRNGFVMFKSLGKEIILEYSLQKMDELVELIPNKIVQQKMLGEIKK
ncbi:MAG: hypothetical protein AB7U79_06550 [Candidatus Izemoplasmatales bacterium]